MCKALGRPPVSLVEALKALRCTAIDPDHVDRVSVGGRSRLRRDRT
jgi:hypothetical protein